MYNLVAFSLFTIFYNYHFCLVPRHFITPKRNYLPIINHFPCSPFSSPWQPTICSLSLDLPILDFFYIEGIIHLANVLKIHSSCSMYYYFITFFGQIIFYCTGITHCFLCIVNEPWAINALSGFFSHLWIQRGSPFTLRTGQPNCQAYPPHHTWPPPLLDLASILYVFLYMSLQLFFPESFFLNSTCVVNLPLL